MLLREDYKEGTTTTVRTPHEESEGQDSRVNLSVVIVNDNDMGANGDAVKLKEGDELQTIKIAVD